MADSRLTTQEQLAQIKRQMNEPGSNVREADAPARPPAAPRVAVGTSPKLAGDRDFSQAPQAVVGPAMPSGPAAKSPAERVPAQTPARPADEVSQYPGRPTAAVVPEPESKSPEQSKPEESRDLDVLIALESDLNERERQHIERVDSLEWDWLGYHNAVKELARERLQAEQKLADRKLELDTLQKQLAAFDAKLRRRETALASRRAKADSDARANRAQAKLLEAQAQGHSATQRKRQCPARC
jgi:hypothetical protein